MQTNKTTNITLRGAGGLLGHRLLRTILTSQRDMTVSKVILDTSEKSFRRFESIFTNEDDPCPKIFIDADNRRFNAFKDQVRSRFELYPLHQGFGEIGRCDAVIDTAIVRGRDTMTDFYDHFSKKKPVIFQSGTYPEHHSIAPPFESPLQSEIKKFRQGDCLISGIAPILAALKKHIRALSISLIVQKQNPLNEYTTNDNLFDIFTNPTLESYVKNVVGELLPNTKVSTDVSEIPGHDYYRCTLRIKLTEVTTREEILGILQHQPRVKIAPAEIAISTGEVKQRLQEQHLERGAKLEPIICFSCPGGVQVDDDEAVIKIAIYSKAITVLPNIDSVRALTQNISMLDSMRLTDEQYGFQKGKSDFHEEGRCTNTITQMESTTKSLEKMPFLC